MHEFSLGTDDGLVALVGSHGVMLWRADTAQWWCANLRSEVGPKIIRQEFAKTSGMECGEGVPSGSDVGH